MRKIAICDDNKAIVDKIYTLCIQFYDIDKVELECFYSGEELLLSNKHFDIIFMDMELDNLNGIETAQEIRKTDIDVLIVIVSGFEAYKKLAYPIHAFDFIDKPIDNYKLINVLKEAELYYVKKMNIVYIPFKIKDGFVKLDVDEIIYFSYENRKIRIVTIHDIFYFYDNMSILANKLKDFNYFMIHRAYIINMKHIIQIKGNDVIMCNNDILPISRHKSKAFKDSYTEYLSKHYI